MKDIVGALVFAVTTPGVTGTFNVGYGSKITINALANEIIRLTKSPIKMEYKPERAGDVKHSMASSDRLRAAGWKPAHSLNEGLAATVEFFQKKYAK